MELVNKEIVGEILTEEAGSRLSLVVIQLIQLLQTINWASRVGTR